MNWVKIEDKMPDFKEGYDFSDSIIVYNGENVIDDVVCERSICLYLSGESYEYEFWTHRFGYDNDSFKVENVTHWMLLPSPPQL
jgi:hypothetical protein